VPLSTEFYDFFYATRNMKIEAYSAIILLFVLHECETWSLIVREEDGLRLWEQGIKEDISV